MGDFQYSWDFHRFTRKLFDYLDEQYPIPENGEPPSGKTLTLHLSIAETMCEGEFLVQNNYGSELRRLRKALVEVREGLESAAPDSGARSGINSAIKALDYECGFFSKYLGQHKRASWLARYVAETCGDHYNLVTRKILTHGTSAINNDEPSTEYGRLVKSALKYLGVAENWRKPTIAVAKLFDYDLRIVPSWDEGQ